MAVTQLPRLIPMMDLQGPAGTTRDVGLAPWAIVGYGPITGIQFDPSVFPFAYNVVLKDPPLSVISY